MLSEVVIRCRQKKYDNIDNKCNGSFLPQKMLPEVVVKKSTLRQRESPQCGIKKIM